MNFDITTSKEIVFSIVADVLADKKLNIDTEDLQRPWGGFYTIEEADAEKFRKAFFPYVDNSDIKSKNKISPKILIVAPGKRLSWQYHHRRSEVWKLIAGQAAVMVSDTDEETIIRALVKGEIVELKQGERHRLIGTDNWGIIAEIWIHTDETNPSDEDDIVRLQDDFGRKSES